MFRRYWPAILVFVVSVLVAIAPVVSVVIAGTLASSYGCTLNEGSVNPCVIMGADRGELLYAMGVAGWFGLLTLPIGAVGVLLSLLIWGALFFAYRKKRG